nr:arsenite efflux MFS transporter ArsK [Phyllobacterium endophyticum]
MIGALGLTQIVGYGTMTYSFSILAPDIARDFGLPLETVFGLYSICLFFGSLPAPYIGKVMDAYGAALVMAVGSTIAAMTFIIAASGSVAGFFAALLLMQLTSSMVLYQAAFLALVQARPLGAGRSITYLTLVAGFSSTLFWPLSASLRESLSWREIYVSFAIMNLAICAPVHVLAIRTRTDERRSVSDVGTVLVPGLLAGRDRGPALTLVSLAFALQTFTLSAVLTHMVPMLETLGLGASAVVVGAFFGPSQVFSRVLNMVFGARMSPLMLATASCASIAIGSAVLAVTNGNFIGAIIFAICAGLGSGTSSIAQGSLPLWLFGFQHYGSITGKITAARLAFGATAPVAFSYGMELFGIRWSLGLNMMLGIVGVAFFLSVRKFVRP